MTSRPHPPSMRLQIGATVYLEHTTVVLLDQLGQGAFGEIWRVHEVAGAKRILALKTSRCASLTPDRCEASQRSLQTEIDILTACRGYPRVVQMIDYVDCRHHEDAQCQWMILLELAEGSLTQYLQSRLDADVYAGSGLVSSTEPDMRNEDLFYTAYHGIIRQDHVSTDGFVGRNYNLIREVAEGCAKAIQQFRLATQFEVDTGRPLSVIHGDIKFDNFLVSGGVIQLADFGGTQAYYADAKELPPEQISQISATSGYLDPDVKMAPFAVSPYTTFVDEYALGAMIWSMAFDAGLTTNPIRNDIFQEAVKLIDKTNAQHLLTAVIMLTNPYLGERWTVDDLLISPFIAPFPSLYRQPRLDPQLILLNESRQDLQSWSNMVRNPAEFHLTSDHILMDIINNYIKAGGDIEHAIAVGRAALQADMANERAGSISARNTSEMSFGAFMDRVIRPALVKRETTVPLYALLLDR